MNTTKFKTTSIAVGDSVSVIINDVKEGKFGPIYLATVNGNSVELQPSGNLKFLADDLAQGKKEIGKAYTVTRKPDIKSKTGYNLTQFSMVAGSNNAQTTTATSEATVSDKLAAIRAKRAQSSSNS